MEILNLRKEKWRKRFTYRKVMGFEKQLPFRMRFQVVRFRKNGTIKDHYHLKTLEIFVTTRGSGKLFINGKKFFLNKNNIFLIEPKDAHAITNDGKGILELTIFKPFEKRHDMYWGRIKSKVS